MILDIKDTKIIFAISFFVLLRLVKYHEMIYK